MGVGSGGEVTGSGGALRLTLFDKRLYVTTLFLLDLSKFTFGRSTSGTGGMYVVEDAEAPYVRGFVLLKFVVK